MVGLSVLLESNENDMFVNRRRWTRSKTRRIVNQTLTAAAMKKMGFLQTCFQCKHRLMENKDIFMYMGDMAFCSEDCRLEYMNMETKVGGVAKKHGEIEEDCKGRRSGEHNVINDSLFLDDFLPSRHDGRNGYRSRAS